MKCQQWVCGSVQGQLSCVCIYWGLLFGILSHSPLVLREMNQGESVWVVHFIICLRGSVCAGHGTGGSLFSSCSVCLSHCVHTSFILLFLPLLNPALSCCLTRMRQSWLMEELCPSCLLQSLCILPWPISLTPWSLLCSSHAGSLCALGFSSVWGRSCLMHWPLQLWQGQLLNCEWETEGTT